MSKKSGVNIEIDGFWIFIIGVFVLLPMCRAITNSKKAKEPVKQEVKEVVTPAEEVTPVIVTEPETKEPKNVPSTMDKYLD